MEKEIFEFKNGKLSIKDGVRFVEAQTFADEEALDFRLAQVKELVIPQSVRDVEVFAFEGFCNLERIIVPARLLRANEGYSFNDMYYTCSYVRMLKDRSTLWACPNLKTVVVMADKNGTIDFRHYYAPTKAVTYCEGEVKKLILTENPCGTYYINAYVEDVEVEGVDKQSYPKLFFRAPKANEEPADGKLVKLTEAYSDWNRRHNFEYFWSMPITLHSSAVTYIKEKKLDCYESRHHIGTRLYFIGIVPKELTEEEKQRFVEGYPYVDVWESPEFVVNKLKQAGWGQ